MNSRTLIIALVTAAIVTVAWALLEEPLLHATGLPHALLVFVVALIPALVVGMSAAHTPAAPQSVRLPEGGRRTAAAAAPSAASPSASASESSQPAFDGPREKGNVKWFNRTKGFGFIVCANGDEIFVHHRSIRGEPRQSLADGEPVEFVIVEHPKGLQAEDVTRDAP